MKYKGGSPKGKGRRRRILNVLPKRASHLRLFLPFGHATGYPLQPSCDHGGSCEADRCRSSATKVSVLPDPLPFATHACVKCCFETVPEVDAEEAVDARIDAAIEVGHEMKSCAHGFQVSVIETIQDVESCQDICDQNWRPTKDEKYYDSDKHLDYL